jgi:hypothetical protein
LNKIETVISGTFALNRLQFHAHSFTLHRLLLVLMSAVNSPANSDANSDTNSDAELTDSIQPESESESKPDSKPSVVKTNRKPDTIRKEMRELTAKEQAIKDGKTTKRKGKYCIAGGCHCEITRSHSQTCGRNPCKAFKTGKLEDCPLPTAEQQRKGLCDQTLEWRVCSDADCCVVGRWMLTGHPELFKAETLSAIASHKSKLRAELEAAEKNVEDRAAKKREREVKKAAKEKKEEEKKKAVHLLLLILLARFSIHTLIADSMFCVCCVSSRKTFTTAIDFRKPIWQLRLDKR